MVDIERLRLFNRLNLVLSKSPFLELAPQEFSDSSANIQSALEITAFEQSYALQCRDFQFMQMFQDFKDLDPNTTDPLLLMGILELFLSGLLTKGSAVVQSQLKISEYLINFKPQEYFDRISFYLKFKNHKFACELFIKDQAGRKALQQVLDELVKAHPQWLGASSLNGGNAPAVAANSALASNSALALAPGLAAEGGVALSLSLRLGWTVLPLQSFKQLKVGDAVIFDHAPFKQNLIEVRCNNLGCISQVDFAKRSMVLTGEFTSIHGLHTALAEKITLNQASQSQAGGSDMAQDETAKQVDGQSAEAQQAQADSGNAQQPLTSLNDLQLELSFELERRNIPLKELKGLVKGSVLPLQDTDLSNVAVLVNDQVVARGQIVDLDSSCALQITEICKLD